MKEIESIVGIFKFFNPSPVDQNDSYYYILYLLDEKGILEKQEAIELFESEYRSELAVEGKSQQKLIGPFVSIERLDQFAFALCEKYNAAKINLLSIDEYNSLIETHQEVHLLHQDILEKGNIITNIERKKKGLLSRFFS
jgi:hypothetical protein